MCSCSEVDTSLEEELLKIVLGKGDKMALLKLMMKMLNLVCLELKRKAEMTMKMHMCEN